MAVASLIWECACGDVSNSELRRFRFEAVVCQTHLYAVSDSNRVLVSGLYLKEYGLCVLCMRSAIRFQ